MKLPKIDFKAQAAKLNTPTAYSAYATVGVLVTTVLAVVCTRKHYKQKNPQVDILENEPTREEVIQEVKDTVKTFAPVIISAATTIFCIRKSNQKWIMYNQLINNAYISARDKMARYRALAPAVVGAEVVQGFKSLPPQPSSNIEWFCIHDFPDNLCDKIGTVYSYGFQPIGTKCIYFQSTLADVIEAEYHLNRNFALRGSASVREFFAFLGILDQFPEEYGDCYGWDVQVMIEDWGIEPWIDFCHSHTIDEDTGQIINIIDYTWEPHFDKEYRLMAWGYGPTGSDFNGRPMRIGPMES